jgi:addiction module HigA family antidote
MIRVPTHRPPTHPGEMLVEEFLIPMDISQRELADALRVPYQRIKDLAKGRKGITPSIALRLERFFGSSADFWLNLQMRWDLYQSRQSVQRDLNRIQRYKRLAS